MPAIAHPLRGQQAMKAPQMPIRASLPRGPGRFRFAWHDFFLVFVLFCLCSVSRPPRSCPVLLVLRFPTFFLLLFWFTPFLKSYFIFPPTVPRS
ncbi:hypothetical protein QBC34DRAFT_390525, partial [Podospora aff. communis PSN243]